MHWRSPRRGTLRQTRLVFALTRRRRRRRRRVRVRVAQHSGQSAASLPSPQNRHSESVAPRSRLQRACCSASPSRRPGCRRRVRYANTLFDPPTADRRHPVTTFPHAVFAPLTCLQKRPPARLFCFETARRAAQPAQACLRWGRRYAAPWKDSTSPDNTTNNHPHLPQDRQDPIPTDQTRTPTLRHQRPSAPEQPCFRIPGQKTGRLLRATASRLVRQGQTSGFTGPAFGGCYGAAGAQSAPRLPMHRPGAFTPRCTGRATAKARCHARCWALRSPDGTTFGLVPVTFRPEARKEVGASVRKVLFRLNSLAIVAHDGKPPQRVRRRVPPRLRRRLRRFRGVAGWPLTLDGDTRSLRRCAPLCLSALVSAFRARKAVGGYPQERAASAPVAQSAFPALHAAGATAVPGHHRLCDLRTEANRVLAFGISLW